MSEAVVVLIPVAVVVVISILRDRQNRRLSRCEVCHGTAMPICEECCRCKNSECNGGCIYCRVDLPFGRILR